MGGREARPCERNVLSRFTGSPDGPKRGNWTDQASRGFVSIT
jgi:hypothetical protein